MPSRLVHWMTDWLICKQTGFVTDWLSDWKATKQLHSTVNIRV